MTSKREPATIGECDREIADYRMILTTVSPKGRVAVWEQIDKLLELRLTLAGVVLSENSG